MWCGLIHSSASTTWCKCNQLFKNIQSFLKRFKSCCSCVTTLPANVHEMLQSFVILWKLSFRDTEGFDGSYFGFSLGCSHQLLRSRSHHHQRNCAGAPIRPLPPSTSFQTDELLHQPPDFGRGGAQAIHIPADVSLLHEQEEERREEPHL